VRIVFNYAPITDKEAIEKAESDRLINEDDKFRFIKELEEEISKNK